MIDIFNPHVRLRYLKNKIKKIKTKLKVKIDEKSLNLMVKLVIERTKLKLFLFNPENKWVFNYDDTEGQNT